MARVFYYTYRMNNPIVRFPLELLLTILLVFAVLGKPTETIVEKEMKSTDSFCDCEMDREDEFKNYFENYHIFDSAKV